MASRESIQRRLESVRPPRVRLTYDVEVGDAVEQKELPFVVGVVGPFSGPGRPDVVRPKLKERKFVAVDVDNFDDVMNAMGPAATFQVADRLGGDGRSFEVELDFRALDDFRPESVVRQVEPLRHLLALRQRLAELRNTVAGNDRLHDLLTDALAAPACDRFGGAAALPGSVEGEPS